MKKIISLILAVLLIGFIIVPASASGMDDFQLAFFEDTIQDVENNTSIEDAQAIQSGQTILGRMRLPVSWKGLTMPDGTVSDDYMDMDYFKFTLTQDSIVFLAVFPQDYETDNYMMATISDESDTTLARTEAFEGDDGVWLSAIFEQPLSAGTYYITFLCGVDSTKYNGAEYMGYFEAIPANTSGVVSPSTEHNTQSQGSLSNFVKVNTYTVGEFTDVSATTWCADNVQTAYEYGLMSGKSGSYFDTNGDLTIAQAIVMACRLHNIYYGNNYTFHSSDPWYQDYLNYALSNGIIESSYENYDVPISRAGFAIILNGALPDSALNPINTIEDQSIPDVPAGSNYYNAVYRLYRAGILTGNDSKGTFTPFSHITRGAAAAIVSRMADTTLRKSITLNVSSDPTSVTLSASSQTIYVGEGVSLTATVLPSSASNKAVTWESSNRAVATVEDGYVYGNAPGTATITAKTSNGKTASCTITVRENTSSQGSNQGSSTSAGDINSFNFTPYAKAAYEYACLYSGQTIGVTDLWGGFSPNRQYVIILLESRSEGRVYRVRYSIGAMSDPVISTIRTTAWDYAQTEINMGAIYKELNISTLI